MKENEFIKIITKPIIDSSMDQTIANSILHHDTNANKKNTRARWMQTGYLFSQKALSNSISKIAVAVIVLSLVGAGTVWAAGIYVKSYKSEIQIMTEDEVDVIKDDIISLDRENAVKKYFGNGNKLIGPAIDMNGNILEIDEEGYYTHEDGTKVPASYIPDPNRYENARTSGDEAFAEMGYPNLIPSYLYDNYILETDGFIYAEFPESSYKEIMVEFLTDAYNGGDFYEENIWVTFSPSETSVENPQSIYRLNYDEDDYITSSYTTKGGINCSILEDKVTFHIIAEINFDSETIGNGHMMIEFVGMEWDKVTEILNTLPLTEDNVDSQTVK